MQKLKFLLVFLGASMLMSQSSFADRCVVLTKEEKNSALKLLTKGGSIIEYCEACGTEAKHYKISSVKSVAFDTSRFTVQVNGTEIDLAYIFIKLGENNYLNTAHAVGSCNGAVRSDMSEIPVRITYDLQILEPKSNLSLECLPAPSNNEKVSLVCGKENCVLNSINTQSHEAMNIPLSISEITRTTVTLTSDVPKIVIKAVKRGQFLNDILEAKVYMTGAEIADAVCK